MARRLARRGAQRGAALLALMMVAVLAFAYVLASRLNAASQFVAADREQNARALGQAKRALIGYVAQQAALAAQNNPGSLPCPEAPAYFGTANEGIAAGNCALPAVGRLPWRTLGVDKLVDAAGEPLWYVVSPNWALSCSTCTTLINSDSTGNLTVDGAANDAVALLIAPGAAMSVQAGAGCTAWAQARPASGAPDLRNYLECGNAAGSFVTSSPGNTFNDQVVRVRAEDVVPALEAAIQDRAQREIAPVLKAVYTSSQFSGIPSSSPMYPYAVAFVDPGTSNYQGAAGVYQGLLPFNQTQGCNPATDPRCTTTFVAWASATPPTAAKTGGYGTIQTQTCSWQSGGNIAVCEGDYLEDPGNPSGAGMFIEMSASINNVAMGLRKLDWTKAQVKARNPMGGAWQQMTLEPSPGTAATMNPDGSVTVKFSARLPNIDAMGWGTNGHYQVSLERAVIGDHFLLDAATTGPGASTSWFVRNGWYRVTYYATAQTNTASSLPSFDCTSSNCLRFNDSGTRNIRALLVLAGRKLDTQARPSSSFSDYVEYQNADGGTLYEQRPMRMGKVADPSLNAPWNDRVILVDWAYPLDASQAASVTPLLLVTKP